jgi:hypothetical protein
MLYTEHLPRGKLEHRKENDMDFQMQHLGSGYEGAVYQIAPNLVKKVWNRNFFGMATVRDIVHRIERVFNQIYSMPQELKDIVFAPELVGYEVDNGIVITYHDYIEKEGDMIYSSELAQKVMVYFSDCGGDNWCISRGKICLIDVAVRGS